MALAPILTQPRSNAEIARRLLAYAQLLQAKGENPFKVRAYRRAAQTIKGLSEGIDALVRAEADVTRFPGIGKELPRRCAKSRFMVRSVSSSCRSPLLRRRWPR